MLNVCVLNGRLCNDPELRTTSTGTDVATLRLAVERDFAEKDGTHGCDFITVKGWSKTAQFIGKYFHKGDMIAVTGRLTMNSYDKDGQKRTSYEVVADKVSFVGGQKTEKKDVGIDVQDDEDWPF